MATGHDEDGGRLYWDDIATGDPIVFGRYALSADEIVAFAREFDPQPMHLDEEAAQATVAGGLCAAGLHSCGILMRIFSDHYLSKIAILGSPGADEVRFLQPVRPDSVLSVRYTCLEKRISKSRPSIGICKSLIELLDTRGTVLLLLRPTLFVKSRIAWLVSEIEAWLQARIDDRTSAT